MPVVQRPYLALLLRLAAAFCLATLIMLVKVAAESGIAFPEILFWRTIITLPILAGWLAARGQIHRLRTRRMPVHLRRAAMGLVGMMMTFSAPILLPLAEATTLGFTTPIFAVLLSTMLLRERIGPWRWGAVLAGFAGILVIAQPGHAHMPLAGTAVGLGGALMVALISIQIRDLARTEEPIAIVFWFSFWASVIYTLALPFFVSGHTAGQWTLLVTIGVLGCAAQLLLTASLQLGQVASVIVMDYSSLVWATLYGWLVWDRLPPSTTWMGAPLIIGAGALIAWREHRLAKRVSPVSMVAAD
ncbi:EamA-like transporter family protein [Novosphingobium kunmingense]|uniref:EamA-like transporter family protein n=1 Tax=Novosphingobium kunmingense TaxID=1211806 RepID=A0A2N0I1K3_9SPHN|nr:DMT family transporter [Novosphingobium kunmingense]PKB25041.1 EamA-like transporter family protein [Novosphingobium kunmingense]